MTNEELMAALATAERERDEAREESERHRDEWNDSADAARKFAGQRDTLAAQLTKAREALGRISKWSCCNPNGGESPHTRLARETLAALATPLPSEQARGAREP